MKHAVERADNGQLDANLGGEVIKQRIARPGGGKSKGYRVVILLRRGTRAFFMYGFSKSERGNIDQGEEQQFKDAAKHILGLSEEHLSALIDRGDFTEVKNR